MKLLHRARLLSGKNGSVRVLIPTDFTITELKGTDRPKNNEYFRELMLSRLKDVDWVEVYGDVHPGRRLDELRMLGLCDLYVKGGDYKGQHLPEFDYCKGLQEMTKYIFREPGYSTSEILHQQAAGCAPKSPDGTVKPTSGQVPTSWKADS